ncbi:Uncharacterized protein TCM_041616 [Theobroma cacao]|uniref:Uncharacterized protein n=1 Tax=Theobroma cacao TaxID=3641 RepID=A0A061GV69_THECC|nr:Uncharacterized protein TCM_041616 [Theobroma cacao]
MCRAALFTCKWVHLLSAPPALLRLPLIPLRFAMLMLLMSLPQTQKLIAGKKKKKTFREKLIDSIIRSNQCYISQGRDGMDIKHPLQSQFMSELIIII